MKVIYFPFLFFYFSLATYLILFGFTVKPVFQKSLVWPCQVVDKCISISSSTQKHKTSRDTNNEENVLFHNCTLTPDIVREEVECLKQDFNNRVKQVLFNSMLTAYYMAFVPLCFAQVWHLHPATSKIMLLWHFLKSVIVNVIFSHAYVFLPPPPLKYSSFIFLTNVLMLLDV